MIAPTLQTERLTLRMPRIEDFEHHAAFHASERAEWEGGVKARKAAWRIWASDVGTWALRGYGAFTVEMDGVFVGEVLFNPPSCSTTVTIQNNELISPNTCNG